ncbi:glycoside hydrolase family 29 protein [Cylindrobasidium torrendii FP15055 ss-10]|uniref:alpha-L-fucosidase n=1 Tax=Cylindrobasidium torrendii FP15055 ss-10 TaxID=1314674 RepID=A0A0D7BF29_9AGAR|nr:glycoside hydrolase family 29 protein [Cylindrobasidium torrendii FP15055 ss-10]
MTQLTSDTNENVVHSHRPQPYPSKTALSDLQKAFLDLRLTMFLHYNMATYQDREWGDEHQPVDLFDPTDLDTDQWADAAVSANMQGAFLTTKHHDGFCIWPTKTGVASVLQTPKKLDVVGAYARSFRKRGLKVGLYYSILDKRNDIRHFNITPKKVQLIKDQLTELLTEYGTINMIIVDGWYAPWSRIPYTELHFDEIYCHVKKLQPDCLFTDLNGALTNSGGMFYGDIKAFEQNAGEVLPNSNPLPALGCVTLTDGWFWKLKDIDADLKSVEQVVDEWLIPQNARHCTLIVNAPPNREGRIAPNLVKRLEEIGDRWKYPGPAEPLGQAVMEPITTNNLAQGCMSHCSDHADTYGPDFVNDGNDSTTWYSPIGQKTAWLEIVFPKPTAFNRVVLTEPIGRFPDYHETRIGKYRWEALVRVKHGHSDADAAHHKYKWIKVASGTSLGPGVVPHWVERTVATRVRYSFDVKIDTAHVVEVGVYDEPGRERAY